MSTEKKSYSGRRTDTASCSLAAVSLLLLAGVAAGITTIGLNFPTSDSPYKTKLIEARDGLSEGSLIYTMLSDSKAGDSLSFEATLSGNSGRKPVTPDGKGEKPAPSGAMMGAKLHCSGASVKCVSNSSEKKPVLRTQDDASWSWTIDTPKAGKAFINLTITAYFNDTDIVLEEPIPVRQELEIYDDENAFLRFAKSAWKEILAALTAIGGLGGLLAVWQHRRSDRGSSSSNDGSRNENSNPSQSAQVQSDPTGRPPGNQPPDAADTAGASAPRESG